MELSYTDWFKKIIEFFLNAFLFFAVISTVYVFTYPFGENIKIIAFLILFLAYAGFAYVFKDKIKTVINKCLDYNSKLSILNMFVIITVILIVLKVVYTILFKFDSTQDGDIQIYASIAESIANGQLDSSQLSHLLGVGFHLAVFNYLNIPYHIGIFIVFYIGAITNLYSFSNIIGKEKTFFIILLYILMPSTMLLTFCPTHELFVYMYLSLFFLVFNKFILEDNRTTLIIYFIILTIVLYLLNTVTPMGKVIYIIIGLMVLFSNLSKNKKISIVLIMILSIAISSSVSYLLKADDTSTTLNTYYILVRGSSVECRGEHVDGYTNKLVKQYLLDYGLEYSKDNELFVIKKILLDQYIYLFKHPIEFIQLLCHKFYIIWSGDHYSVELAFHYGAFGNITYYIFLSVSTILYLFVLSISLFFYTKKEDNLFISNFKLLILGIAAVLLISLVLNKYSVYATLFLYLICIYRFSYKADKE